MKGHRLNSRSDSRPIIGSDFVANISSQLGPQLSSKPRLIIGPISIANIGCQHCELGPIIGPIIFSYMGTKIFVAPAQTFEKSTSNCITPIKVNRLTALDSSADFIRTLLLATKHGYLHVYGTLKKSSVFHTQKGKLREEIT